MENYNLKPREQAGAWNKAEANLKYAQKAGIAQYMLFSKMALLEPISKCMGMQNNAPDGAKIEYDKNSNAIKYGYKAMPLALTAFLQSCSVENIKGWMISNDIFPWGFAALGFIVGTKAGKGIIKWIDKKTLNAKKPIINSLSKKTIEFCGESINKLADDYIDKILGSIVSEIIESSGSIKWEIGAIQTAVNGVVKSYAPKINEDFKIEINDLWKIAKNFKNATEDEKKQIRSKMANEVNNQIIRYVDTKVRDYFKESLREKINEIREIPINAGSRKRKLKHNIDRNLNSGIIPQEQVKKICIYAYWNTLTIKEKLLLGEFGLGTVEKFYSYMENSLTENNKANKKIFDDIEIQVRTKRIIRSRLTATAVGLVMALSMAAGGYYGGKWLAEEISPKIKLIQQSQQIQQ